MKRLFSFLFWCLLFLGACLGLDQLLVRVEMPVPALTQARTFYLDFRTRLVHLVERVTEEKSFDGGKVMSPRTPEVSPVRPKASEPPSTANGKKTSSVTAKPSSPTTEDAPRYLYVDGKGALLFADRLEDIPAVYRKDAQSLAR